MTDMPRLSVSLARNLLGVMLGVGVAFPTFVSAQGQPTAPNPVSCEGQPGAPPARGGSPPPQPPAPQSLVPRQVTVTAIPGIVAAGATFTQVWQAAGNNADGIVAMADGSVLVNQEDTSDVLRIDANDKVSVFVSDTHGSGSLSLRNGRVYAVQRLPMPSTAAAGNPSAPKTAGISLLYPERKMIADTFSDGSKWMGRPNDLTADPMGGAYFSQGCVYHASASGTITLAATDIRSNGIVLSPDDKTLYVTNGTSLAVFDIAAPGKLTNRRQWRLEAGGTGDGTTVDSTGRVYVSSTPGVQIFSAAGKYLGLIPTPRPLTGVLFAGSDLKTLYLVGVGATDENGKPSIGGPMGRTIYKIPVLAQGFKGHSK